MSMIPSMNESDGTTRRHVAPHQHHGSIVQHIPADPPPAMPVDRQIKLM